MGVFFYVRETEDGDLLLEADGLEDADNNSPLEASLRKWEILSDYAEAGLLVYDGGATTCALCRHHRGCVGCPIGRVCSDTPYNDYVDHCRKGDLDAALIAAKAMAALLRELLEENLLKDSQATRVFRSIPWQSPYGD